MRNFRIAAAVGLVLTVAVAGCGGRVDEKERVRQVINEFVEANNTQNASRLAATLAPYVSIADPSGLYTYSRQEYLDQTKASWQELASEGLVLTLQTLNLKVTLGDSTYAVCSWHVTSRLTDPKGTAALEVTLEVDVYLAKYGGRWLIHELFIHKPVLAQPQTLPIFPNVKPN